MPKHILIFAALLFGSPLFADCNIGFFTSLPSGTYGQPYSGQVTAGSICPGTFTYALGNFPGVSIDSRTGVLSGTIPAGTGTKQIIVSITATETLTPPANPPQVSSTAQFGVLLIDPNNPTLGTPCMPQILTLATLPPATLNQPYEEAFQAGGTGCSNPLWSSSGALPPGLFFSSSGTLAGTPSMVGVFSVNLTVSSGGATASQQFSLTVAAAAGSPGNSTATPTSSLPHFAVQGSWTFGVSVVNTATKPANFSIAFYDDNGKPISLPFPTGSTSVLSGTIPAQGSAYYEASDPSNPAYFWMGTNHCRFDYRHWGSVSQQGRGQ